LKQKQVNAYLITIVYYVNRGVTQEDVYLWDLEHLGKYFKSEGDGIENTMAALAREKTGDKDADAEAAHRAKYNKLIGKDECILANIRRKPGANEAVKAYVRAGPRAELHFNPKTVNAAIVTCGGLCPGLNNVVREITRTLYFMYGIEGKVYGIVGGYKGFYDPKTPPIVLTPENVENIHHEGGTILGSSRGGFDMDKILAFIKSKDIRQLYVIGGDGTHRGAFKIHETCMEKGLHVAVAGIPKVSCCHVFYVSNVAMTYTIILYQLH
jgi:6-phosphofructokinase 1